MATDPVTLALTDTLAAATSSLVLTSAELEIVAPIVDALVTETVMLPPGPSLNVVPDAGRK